jgi:hypothetical protein
VFQQLTVAIAYTFELFLQLAVLTNAEETHMHAYPLPSLVEKRFSNLASSPIQHVST